MKKGRRDRRVGALDRLETQLESGTKTQKKTGKTVSLTEADKKRISKEIGILKSSTAGGE
jgi:hypothetical protein